ncbi:FimV/HubP family polar landmark protein [Aliiglaciecola sp. SL4]|uniref:FimV/HubP family polar landmark protein n=1 Tax=Aliiglaciecola sp. SL4 TaxID=3239806 RepID=UPI00355BB2E8
MNVRQVAFLLFASVGLLSISATIDAQQLQIRGSKSNTAELSGSTYGPVVPEDTLWRIASKYRQNKTLSVYQVMQAIYQLNPDAFEDQNFNHLVDGSILKLPSERYVARIDPKAAQMKAEQDDNAWRAFTKGETQQVIVKTSQEAASKNDLTETKQVIEEKLSALDAEQNRQFTAIRQQFAESIESVQTLLNENRKLVDRLDTVDTEISSLRGRVDEELQVQMDQMLALQNELLSISREAESQRKAEMEKSGFAWLTDPLFLILLSVLLTISLLGAFAMWLIRRKRPEAESEAILDENHAAILEQSDEMDDLADALTNELSEELEDSDDDLFGDDDLLDDVLSEELEESLDANSDENFEAFDDLDDDSLDPVIEESTADAAKDDGGLEDDLDNLFDEDELLADIGDELGDADAELDPLTEQNDSQELEKDDLDLSESNPDEIDNDETDELGELPDLDIDIPEDKADKSEPTTDDSDVSTELPAAVITPPAIDDEPDKPEISIDELLEQPLSEEDEDSIISDNSDVMDEEMLQSIDKEIHQQNAQLDNITDELLNEIEQLEQMGGMLEEETESIEEPDPTESQMGIQELDSLSENLDEDDVIADLSDDSVEELDIADEPVDTIDDVGTDSSINTQNAEQPSEVEDNDKVDADDIDDLLNQQSVEDSSVESLSADELLAELESDKQTQTDELAALDSSLSVDSEDQQSKSEEPTVDEIKDTTEQPTADEVQDTVEQPAVDEVQDTAEQPTADEVQDTAEQPAVDEVQDTAEEPAVDEVQDTAEQPTVDEVQDSAEQPAVDEVQDTAEQPTVDEVQDSAEQPAVDEVQDIAEQPTVDEVQDTAEQPTVDEVQDSAEQPAVDEVQDSAEQPAVDETQDTAEQPAVDEVQDIAEEPAVDEVQDIAEEPAVDEVQDTADPLEAKKDLPTETRSENDTTSLDSDEIEDLDKALDDFEQEVVSEATSFDVELDGDNLALPSEDLDEMQLEQIIPIEHEDDIEKVLSDFDEKIPSIDDIDSLSTDDSDGFDDADLDEALRAFDEDYLADQDSDTAEKSAEKSENVELDDLPGLGDWLSSEEAAETNSLDELENTSFDELLDSIDATEDNSEEVGSIDDKDALSNIDSGLDFDALLNDVDTPSTQHATSEAATEQKSEEDFLDVDDLIKESIEAEGSLDIDKELNLAAAFESYEGFGEADEVDVDSDNGIGAKLDLAQAYIETDDIESAKELLEEVLQNGDDTQQEEAKELLKKLA